MKPGGMCWTMTDPVPSGDGSFGISSPRAFGPPVEEAIITNFFVALRGRTAERGRGRGGRSGGQRTGAA